MLDGWMLDGWMLDGWMDVGWMDGCWMDGWFEKAELKQTKPSLAGAWLSLAKHKLHLKFDPQNEFQILLKLNTFDLSLLIHLKKKKHYMQ